MKTQIPMISLEKNVAISCAPMANVNAQMILYNAMAAVSIPCMTYVIAEPKDNVTLKMLTTPISKDKPAKAVLCVPMVNVYARKDISFATTDASIPAQIWNSAEPKDNVIIKIPMTPILSDKNVSVEQHATALHANVPIKASCAMENVSSRKQI